MRLGRYQLKPFFFHGKILPGEVKPNVKAILHKHNPEIEVQNSFLLFYFSNNLILAFISCFPL